MFFCSVVSLLAVFLAVFFSLLPFHLGCRRLRIPSENPVKAPASAEKAQFRPGTLTCFSVSPSFGLRFAGEGLSNVFLSWLSWPGVAFHVPNGVFLEQFLQRG